MDLVIAIVGRPNVGKSALFNRLARRRIAIVHDQAGITRDRISALVDWGGRMLTLLDTGGIGLMARERAKNAITGAAIEQAELAIASAQIIVLVVNVKEGVLPLDIEVATRLRQSGKRILIAANKSDTPKDALDSADFQSLGFDTILPISAIHGRGMQDFTSAIDDALSKLPHWNCEKSSKKDDGFSQKDRLKLAFVGRPNVGKSSLINAISKSQRVIVSPFPGTTRDSIDVPFSMDCGKHYLLIDTAGMRKKRRVENSIEFFSVKRTEDSIARSDIVIHVLDAQAGVTFQDKKIADAILKHQKACILVINKWDLYADAIKATSKTRKASQNRCGNETLSMFGDWVRKQMFFVDHAPVIFTSAKNGFSLDKLLKTMNYVSDQLRQSIPTAAINRTLHNALDKQTSNRSGARLKFFYATQITQSPPRFLLFVNQKDLFSKQHERHLMRAIRRDFGFEGCPLILIPKSRPKNVEPIRRKMSSKKAAEKATAFKNGKARQSRRSRSGLKSRGKRSSRNFLDSARRSPR